MLNDITFGQFYPSDSFVHKMDPRFKLVIMFAFIIILFVINSFAGYIAAGIFVLLSIIMSKVPIKLLAKNLKPLWFVFIFMFALNLFFTRTGNVVFNVWIIKITDDGIIKAIVMLVRLIMLIFFTGLLTLTTSPISLTVGIESLFGPLKKIKFPVHEMAMMMTIALRFIPTLIEETDKIMKAQMARGASFDTGNIMQKVKSMIPLFIPLFVSAFRRADELALAMTSRCYRGGEGRTRMTPLKVTANDYIASIMSLLFCGAMIAFEFINIF